MILNKLHMVNFKRFKDEEILFPEGIIGVVGENGSGKSSILEAIVFSLYGVQGTSVNSDFILSSAANPKDKTTVSLEFELNGETYTVDRTFKKAKTIHHDAHLYRGQILIADSVSGVADAISQIIGMNAADLQHTVYAGQNDLKSIILATPSVRKDWFMKVIGIQDLKKTGGDLLKDEASQIHGKISAISGFIAAVESKNLPDQIRQKTEEAHIHSDLSVHLKKDLEDISVYIKDLSAKILSADTEYEKYSKLSQSRESLKYQFEEKMKEIEREDERFEAKNEEYMMILGSQPGYEKYLETLKPYELMEEIRSRHALLISSIDQNEKKIQTCVSKKPDIEKKITSLSSEKESCYKLKEDLFTLIQTTIPQNIKDMDAEIKSLGPYKEKYLKVVSDIGILESKIEDLVKLSPTDITVPPEFSPAISDHLDKLDALVLMQSGLQTDLMNHNKDLGSASGNWSRIKKQIADLENLKGKSTCPLCNQDLGEGFSDMLIRMKKEESEASKEVDALKQKGKEIEDNIISVSNLIREVEVAAKVMDLHTKYVQLYASKGELLKEKEELFPKYELSVQKDKDHMDLQQKLTHTTSQFNQNTDKLDLLSKSLESAQQEMITNEETITDANNQISSLRAQVADLNYDPDSRDKMKKILDDTKHLYDLYLKKEGCEQVIETLQRTLIELNDKCEILSEQIQQISDDIDASTYDPVAHKSLKDEKIFKDEEKAGLQVRINQVENDIRSCNEAVQSMEKELESVKELVIQKNDLDQDLAITTMTRNALMGFLEHLLTLIRSNLVEETNLIINEVTNGRYTSIEITDNFEILVEDITGAYPVSRFSGGEQDVIAVALRIAVSRFIANLHQIRHSTFLIFDEIFGSQDPVRRNGMIQAFRNQGMRFPQILLISHIPDIQEEFENIISVERVSDKVSKISCSSL